MKCSILWTTLLASLLLGGAIVPAQGQDTSVEELEERAFKEAAAIVSPSIVRIQTVGGLDRVGRLMTGTGPTTGVAVSEDGYVISSAFNFASKPASILVTLPDGRRFPANIVSTDKSRMLVLLKIETNNLVPAVAADKKLIRVGQWAIALGRTYDSAVPNASVGIISALNRIWGKAIQTDAKISPMNYGGPLVNVEGRVMGILVPLSQRRGATEIAGVEWYDSGIGFAVPLQDIYASLDQMKSGKDLMPGLMGINLKGRDIYSGEPVIDRVRYDSPAEKAGLKRGDVITDIDGQPVIRQAQVLQALGNKLAGDTLDIVVKRKDQVIRKEGLVLVAKLEPYEPAFLGILPAREDLADEKTVGAVVRFVYPDSPAAKAGIERRDRIIRFDGNEVTDANQLRETISRLRPKQAVEIVIQRGEQPKTVDVTLATIPNSILTELSTSTIPSGDQPEEKKADATKTGRFVVEQSEESPAYWAYVPEDYNLNYEYALMVWIHPNNDTMEAEIDKQWKSICDQRGIIVLAPKATELSGWNPNEGEAVKKLVEKFQEDYAVDSNRIFLHSFSTGGRFATHLAFKYRELFRGLALAGTTLQGQPPENLPQFRLQFHFACGKKDLLNRLVNSSVVGLRRMKYPVSYSAVDDLAHKYPPEESIRQISRWADELDRL